MVGGAQDKSIRGAEKVSLFRIDTQKGESITSTEKYVFYIDEVE